MKRGLFFYINKPKKLLSSQEGGVMILFAFSIITLVTSVGVAIDFARVLTARSHAAAALDAALLGAASEADKYSTQAELTERANNYFQANYKTDNGRAEYVGATTSSVDLDISKLSEGRINGSASIDVPLAFGSFVGISSLDIDIKAQVERFIGKDMEIALVLDNTKSMCTPSCTNKFDVMKDSVEELIDMIESAVETSADTGTQISMSLVPFRHGIKINGNDNLKTIFGLGENPGRDNRNVASWFSGLPIVRGLTNDLAVVKNNVRSMSLAGGDSGGTHTATGIVTGWKTLRTQNVGEFRGLSSHQNSARAPQSLATLNDGRVIKAMIVLSDGSNTYWYVGPSAPKGAEYQGKDLHSFDYMNPSVTSACDRAKREGVQIYSIAFVDATDPDPVLARNLMRQCATLPRGAVTPEGRYYFEPRSADELRETFRTIANSLIDKLVTK